MPATLRLNTIYDGAIGRLEGMTPSMLRALAWQIVLAFGTTWHSRPTKARDSWLSTEDQACFGTGQYIGVNGKAHRRACVGQQAKLPWSHDSQCRDISDIFLTSYYTRLYDRQIIR